MVLRRIPALVAAVALSVTALAPPAVAATTNHYESVQHALDAAVNEGGAPGILAEVRDGRGSWFGTAGVADSATGRKRMSADRYRIGSITKTFTATVLLQLQGEGRLDLDDTVEKRLPGVVRGNGNDGSKVTIRQLLNHTSGIFNYTADAGMLAKLIGPPFLDHRYDRVAPRELVAIAMNHPPDFAPGTSWAYSNTNYILAGMIAERVTGRSLATEVTRRIIWPLGLTGTSLPGQSPRILGPHGRHYSRLLLPDPAAPIHDVTELNPSSAGAAGEVISTSADLNKFFGALLAGKLQRPAQQQEMFTTVPTANWIPDTRYGLGIMVQKLSCGVSVWGHPGSIHGSLSWTAGLRNGSKTVSTNLNGDWVDQLGISTDVTQAAFCP